MTAATEATRAEALKQIAALAVWEYGVYPRPLAELLAETEAPACLVAALNNSDTEGVLLEVLRQAPQKVFDGINLAAQAAGTGKRILQIPTVAAALAEELRSTAEKNGISVETGLVNRRTYANSILYGR